MHTLQNILNLFWAPLSRQVDFRDLRWNVAPLTAWRTLMVAVLADLTSQYLVGHPTWWSILASLLTLSVGFLPARLAYPMGGLYIVQAVISTLIELGLNMANALEPVHLAAEVAWGLWCWTALFILILSYIRTPKVH